MKFKKLIALAATATLAMSSMTVMADTIDGEMNYVDTTIYKVTLPTTAGMSFTLDPQGLTALDEGQAVTTNAGKIISDTTNPMKAVNESSVPVILSADFYITDTADTPATLVGAAGITTNSDTSEEDQKEIQLTITPSVATDNSDTIIYVTSSAAGTENKFTMAKAEYTFGGTAETGYTYNLTANSGSEVTMTIGGAIAKDYDWSEYTEGAKITLNAVFKFTDASGADIEVEAEEANTTPVYSKANGASITIDTTKGQVIALASGPAEDNTTATVATSSYSFDKDTKVLTINSGLFSAANAGDTRYFKLTFGDNSTTVISVTVAD